MDFQHLGSYAMKVSKALDKKILSNIRRETQVCFDVAVDLRQQFYNIKGTAIFYNAMVQEFVAEDKQ